MMEEWRAVIDYEGYYEVSNWGNVRSIDRVEIRSNGRPFTIIGKQLSPRMRGGSDRSNYYSVKLYKNKISKDYSIHVLVAKAFIINTNNLPQVNHIDGDTFNNRESNLEWIDNKGNQLHSIYIGRKIGLLKPVEISDIENNPLLIVRSIKIASQVTNADRRNIKMVLEGKYRHANGFKFKYA